MEIASITGVATRLAASIFVRKTRALRGYHPKERPACEPAEWNQVAGDGQHPRLSRARRSTCSDSFLLFGAGQIIAEATRAIGPDFQFSCWLAKRGGTGQLHSGSCRDRGGA